MFYQKLQAKNAIAHLPSSLHADFHKICTAESGLAHSSQKRQEAQNNTAFAFIRAKPVVLAEPELLFGNIVPTRHIQDISICQAIWDAERGCWLPDEEQSFFSAHVATSQFAELLINHDSRMVPLTFTALGGQPIYATHESLDADFILSFAAKHCSEQHRLEQAKTRVASLREQVVAEATVAKINSAFSNLNISHITQSDGTFLRQILHETMAKIDAQVRLEVIHDLSRNAHHHTALLHHEQKENGAVLSINMSDFFDLHFDLELLSSQQQILQHLAGVEAFSELHRDIVDMMREVDTRFTKLTPRQKPHDPVMNTHHLRTARSAGCISVSKPSGHRSFFGDRGDGYAHVEMSFSFSAIEVNEYGEITPRTLLSPNLRIAMTGNQFLELLQSAQIGSWTQCTLTRTGQDGIAFPETPQAASDGSFSSHADVTALEYRKSIAQHAENIKSLLQTKTLSLAKRELIATELTAIEEKLSQMKLHLETSMSSMQAEVIAEHRNKLMPQLSEIIRSARDLSIISPERIEQTLLQLERK